MKVTSGKRCYYCGGVARSGEHIPPKQMFKAFECDSITVPSCDEHNTKKGGHDQAIVNALLIPLYTGRYRYPLEPEVQQAIQVGASSFALTKRSAVRTPFLMNPPHGLEDLPDLVYLKPTVNMTAWIRQLTAGLVNDGIGSASTSIRWSKSIVWSPEWFTADEPIPVEYNEAIRVLKHNQERRLALDSLTWKEGWSAQPEPYPGIIYSFQLHFASNREVIIRHKFYNRYTWYVFFIASKRNIAKLQKKFEQL